MSWFINSVFVLNNMEKKGERCLPYHSLIESFCICFRVQHTAFYEQRKEEILLKKRLLRRSCVFGSVPFLCEQIPTRTTILSLKRIVGQSSLDRLSPSFFWVRTMGDERKQESLAKDHFAGFALARKTTNRALRQLLNHFLRNTQWVNLVLTEGNPTT